MSESDEKCSLILKRETAEAHRHVEQHPLLSRLGSETLDKEHYALILMGFYRFHRGWEPFIKAQDPSVDDLGERLRANTLREDLAALEVDLSPIDSEEILQFDAFDSTPKVLGAMYVVEGSTLGGQVITKMLQKHCCGTLPTSFFRGSGARTKALWDSFKDSLDASVCEENEIREAVGAAKQAFLMTEECMSANPGSSI